MTKDATCYWCGAAAVSEDHVPPKGFYPAQWANCSRIIVPSCAAHNEDLSKLDDKFRTYIQSCSDDEVARAGFVNDTMPRLFRPQYLGLIKDMVSRSTPATLNGGNTVAITTPIEEHDTWFEKIARGIYFEHFRKVFPGKIASGCSHFPSAPSSFPAHLFAHFEPYYIPGKTTNDRVFRYWYFHLNHDGNETFALKVQFYSSITQLSFGTTLPSFNALRVSKA